MRRVLYLSLFLFACAVPALAQDPVKVDPTTLQGGIRECQRARLARQD